MKHKGALETLVFKLYEDNHVESYIRHRGRVPLALNIYKETQARFDLIKNIWRSNLTDSEVEEMLFHLQLLVDRNFTKRHKQ